LGTQKVFVLGITIKKESAAWISPSNAKNSKKVAYNNNFFNAKCDLAGILSYLVEYDAARGIILKVRSAGSKFELAWRTRNIPSIIKYVAISCGKTRVAFTNIIVS